MQKHLDVIHTLKDIVITTQKTRGLTNNYMNGNIVAQLLVYGQRRKMQDDFAQLFEHLKSIELPITYTSQVAMLIEDSRFLNKRAFKSDSAEVFESYSHIIESWIDLNDKVITEGFHTRDDKSYQRLKFMNNVLLPLSENIGKMRGMGSGIVARTYCKEDEVQKMKDFVSEIKRYTMVLKYHLAQNHYNALSRNENLKIIDKIESYSKLTEQKVIERSDIQLVTNAYFDQGTFVISEIMKIYNVVSASLMH